MTKEQDPNRPLSEEGRASARRTAEVASRLGVRVGEIWHSDKLRASQTAEEIGLTLQAARRQVRGLGPNDDIHPVAREIASETGDLMIVGHLPFLGHLTAFLLCGDESLPVVEFQMAGLVRLDRREDARWSLRWSVPPQVVP